MVKLSRPIVLGIDVLVSKQTVKYKHWLAGIDCLIICFIGGLEICFSLVPLPSAVIHRIGGLENDVFRFCLRSSVIHRIGGLEKYKDRLSKISTVIHRIGGLEIKRI